MQSSTGDEPPRPKMQTPPELLKHLRARTGTIQEACRGACKSAWGKNDKGETILLPAPAGEDEARLRFPQYFDGAAPVTPRKGGTVAGLYGGGAARQFNDGLPIPRERTGPECWSEEDAAKSLAHLCKGRLAYIHQTGEWLKFGPRGWEALHRTAIEEACADFAQWNILAKNAKGEHVPAPRSTGRKSIGRAVAQLLEPMMGTELPDWDAAGNLIMMPDGGLLDVFTGRRRRSTPADRIRRRVPVAPATEADYERSVFRRVVESLIPDATEREYLQRRLGAALVDADGMHDLIWLHGPPGAGKGTLLEALRQAFGEYGRGVPATEIIKGARHASHSAWIARLAGARALFADDVPSGHSVEDAQINMLLGSLITAEHKRQAPFDFRLRAPLIVTSNGEPRQTTTNVRRLKPIQCSPAPSEDPAVAAAMSTSAERAACLRWLAVGAFRWRREGCTVPNTIRARAADVASNAPVAVFAESYPPGARVKSAEVWAAWQTFAPAHGCGRLAANQTALAVLLKANGWTARKSHGTRYLIVPDRRVAGGGGFLSDSTGSDSVTREYNQEPATPRHPPSTAEGSEPAGTVPPGFLDGATASGENQDGAPSAAMPKHLEPSPPAVVGDQDAAPVEADPADQNGAPPAGEPADQDGAPPDRLAVLADVLTGDGEIDPAVAATFADPDVAATTERVRAVLGDRTADDLMADARTAAADALAELLQHGEPGIRIAARRLRDGGRLGDDGELGYD